nr:tyramine oxidase [Actinomycetota bacterium]
MTHPLDPLTSDEFAAVAALLLRERQVSAAPSATCERGWRFASIELLEPSKDDLRRFDADGAVPARRATAICLNRSANATYRSV